MNDHGPRTQPSDHRTHIARSLEVGDRTGVAGAPAAPQTSLLFGFDDVAPILDSLTKHPRHSTDCFHHSLWAFILKSACRMRTSTLRQFFFVPPQSSVISIPVPKAKSIHNLSSLYLRQGRLSGLSPRSLRRLRSSCSALENPPTLTTPGQEIDHSSTPFHIPHHCLLRRRPPRVKTHTTHVSIRIRPSIDALSFPLPALTYTVPKIALSATLRRPPAQPSTRIRRPFTLSCPPKFPTSLLQVDCCRSHSYPALVLTPVSVTLVSSHHTVLFCRAGKKQSSQGCREQRKLALREPF